MATATQVQELLGANNRIIQAIKRTEAQFAPMRDAGVDKNGNPCDWDAFNRKQAISFEEHTAYQNAQSQAYHPQPDGPAATPLGIDGRAGAIGPDLTASF